VAEENTIHGKGLLFGRDLYAILTSGGINSSMQLMLDVNLNALEIHTEARPQTQVNPGSTILRRAIRKNIVSFPSQIPAFAKQLPDGIQWRMVLLFFVQGWSLVEVAARFKVPKHRVGQILNVWTMRALALGYVQVIDPEAFAECCRIDIGYGTGRDAEEALWEASRPTPVDLSWPFPESTQSVPASVASALEARPAIGQSKGRLSAIQGGRSNLERELSAHEEEHISHAVA
jgi:hypothetical protein